MSASPLPLAGGVGGGPVSDPDDADMPSPNPSREREGNLKGAGIPANRLIFSEKFACPVSGFTIAEIEPRLFSFNAPQGACPACDGLGERLEFDPDLVVPNHALSLKKGAVVPWAKSNPPSPYYMQVLESLGKAYDFDLTTPWQDLAGGVQQILLYGSGGMPVELTFKDGRRTYTTRTAFEGVIGNRSEEHTSELKSLMRSSSAVLCLNKKKKKTHQIR